MAENTLDLEFANSAQTARYATMLSQNLRAGDVVLLNGSVGAGKTHFARALIKSILHHDEDVPSPTFTLVQTYDTQRGALWHADLYRLSSDFEIEELGLSDAMQDAICLIEWPDRLGVYTPQNALSIELANGDTHDQRQLHARWVDPKWDDAMKGWGYG